MAAESCYKEHLQYSGNRKPKHCDHSQKIHPRKLGLGLHFIVFNLGSSVGLEDTESRE
jgi:hypothetical protein